MIARREQVDAALQQFVQGVAGDAEARGGVLGVGDDEIDAVLPDHSRQELAYGTAAGPSDNVPDEKYLHGARLTSRSPSPSFHG